MKQAFSLPNILTYIRMALIPVFIVLYWLQQVNANFIYIALGVYVLAALTDALDGFIARKYGMVTNIGKVLDPLADKLLKVAVITCFVIDGIIPVWFLLAVIVIDLTLVIVASVLFRREVIIKSNVFGKSGTIVIAVGVLLSFFHNFVNGLNLWVLYSGLGIMFISAISYLVAYLKITKKIK